MSSERKATITYIGDGTQTIYAFPFDYLRKAFVKVQDIAGDNINELTLGTDYSISDKQVSLLNPIPSGDHLKIYRSTTTEPLVEWQDASVLRSADLSLQEVQLLHLSEETLDRVQEGGLSTDPNDSDVWDARFKRLKNLLDPKDDGDAVTLRYINDNRDGIITNITNMGNTQVVRVNTTGNTQNDRITTTGDTQVKRVTDEGNTQDTRITAKGESYVTHMTDLKDVVTGKATDASNSADLSKAWAEATTSPDSTNSKSSKTWATEAKTSASSASASAANAKTSETNAKVSEANAETYMEHASSSEVNARDSAEAASTSEVNAMMSEVKATKSAQEAKTHADNAAQYDPKELISEAHHYIKRSTAYTQGDVLTSPELPYDTIIEVTQTGSTGTAEPDWETIKGDIPDSDDDDTLFKRLLLASHPIGNIYESTDSTSPELLFGGTWEVMDAGRVLVSSGTASTGTVYTAGATGGEEATGLDIAHLPPHSFSGTTSRADLQGSFSGNAWSHMGETTGIITKTYNEGNRDAPSGSTSQEIVRVHVDASHDHTFTTNTLGEGLPHNNMQPYEVVYRWKRTA